MNNVNVCKVCGLPLNKAQKREKHGKKYKSCPNCSRINAQEHVYYEYPKHFGTTPKRATTNNPDGPQSYCNACRAESTPSAEKFFCSDLSENQ